MIYKKVQFNPFILIITFLSIVIIALAAFPLISFMEWLVIAFLVFISIMFSSMTVECNEEQIQWYFGPRLWTKKILLADVVSVTELPAKWYHGYGIRLRENGWLYRIGGESFIELTLFNRTTASIGMNEASLLKSFVSQRVDYN